MKTYDKSDYLYTALFCEENIWLLADSLIKEGINANNIYVLFLGNQNQQISVFNQLSSKPDRAVIWDYHVILLTMIDQSQYIYDFDTRLPFPCKLEHYIHNSFASNTHKQYVCQFRIIPASLYLSRFYSDRSHMINIIDEKHFPDYPPMLSEKDDKITLTCLFDVTKSINNTHIVSNYKELSNWVAAL